MSHKAGAPIGSALGFVLFMVCLILAMLFFYSCDLRQQRNSISTSTISLSKYESASALNYFMAAEFDGKKTTQILEESYLAKDFTAFNRAAVSFFPSRFARWQILVLENNKELSRTRLPAQTPTRNQALAEISYSFPGAGKIITIKIILDVRPVVI